MKSSTFNVAVNLDIRYKPSRRVISGILKYANTHPSFKPALLGNHPSNDGFTNYGKFKFDALITDSTWQTDEIRRVLRSKSLKAVALASTQPMAGLRLPSIALRTDDRAIAAAAAKALMSNGLESFAFVGSLGNEDWSAKRGRFFVDELAKTGYEVKTFGGDFDMKDIDGSRSALVSWLKSLPKPCGLFVALDQRAKHVLDLCRDNGIAVPEQLQVLSVDNEQYICELVNPTLSSISLAWMDAGYNVSAALHALLQRRRMQSHEVLIGVKAIVERLSTSDLRQTGNRVSLAREYIRLNAKNRIDVHDVAAKVGGCLRLLEYDFRKVLGHTVKSEITSARLNEVARMVARTSRGLDDIAAECGFRNSNSLKNLFRKHFGMSMSEYRRAYPSR